MCGIIACRTRRLRRRLPADRASPSGVPGIRLGGDRRSNHRGDVARLRTIGRIGALDRDVRNWSGPDFAGVGIGHTRWATHGPVTEPTRIRTSIAPAESAWCTTESSKMPSTSEALTRAGHRFASSVDSEVLGHLIEDQLDICGDLLCRADGFHPRRRLLGLAVLEQSRAHCGCRSPLPVADRTHRPGRLRDQRHRRDRGVGRRIPGPRGRRRRRSDEFQPLA